MRNTVITIVACVVLAACGDDAADAGKARQAAAEASAFAAEQQAWRTQRHANLVKPDGWTSLVGLHWIEPGAHYVGSAADNGIRIGIGPKHLGLVDRKGEQVSFIAEQGVAVTLDGQPLAGRAMLKADSDEGGPSTVGFDQGNGLATVIKRGDRYALRVKHADAPTRTRFGAIDYWPGGRDWKIAGRFIAHPPGRTIPIANIIGTTEEIPNPGAVEFERDGKSYRLEALDEGDGILFLIYADRTSGHGSYGAGRYLDAPKPDAQGRVMLDFNRGYNPPCAFTAFATCPLPPPENRVDLAITAGEKAYSKTAH